MSTRARLIVAAAIALISAVAIGVLAVHWFARGGRAAAPLDLRETAAVTPFAGYREVRVAIGAKCARVVVADTDDRREEGLRSIDDLGPYAGMLFVQSRDSDVAFTMSGVKAPLDIVWYAADGARVGSASMRPCPKGGAARCPLYRSSHPYRVALETPAGAPAPTRVMPCE